MLLLFKDNPKAPCEDITTDMQQDLFDRVVGSIDSRKRHELGDGELRKMIFNLPEEPYGTQEYKKSLVQNINVIEQLNGNISERAKEIAAILERNNFRVSRAQVANGQYFDPRVISIGHDHLTGHEHHYAILEQLKDVVDIIALENHEEDYRFTIGFKKEPDEITGKYLTRAHYDHNMKILNICGDKVRFIDNDRELSDKTFAALRALYSKPGAAETLNFYVVARDLTQIEPAVLKCHKQGKMVLMCTGLLHTFKPYDLFRYYGIQRIVAVAAKNIKLEDDPIARGLLLG